MDPYQPCPCGSGKTFKWCCQPYFHLVEKARAQHEQGQHDTALRTIQQLVEQHPTSAPVLGYQAELLFLNGKFAEADDALQKSFAIDPNFPLGHYLRGALRKEEGEIIGALLEFRKAAEGYDPKSTGLLAQIYGTIFDIEMRMNRPVAARAALERAIQCEPTQQEIRTAFDQLFGNESRLPASARKAYTFRSADPSRAAAWKDAIPTKGQSRFGEALAAFEKLTVLDEQDAAAWFNLGLICAWVGDHPRAIEALQESIDLDNDDARNAEAGALIEVLRCGEGMTELADHIEHRVFLQIQEAQPLVSLLEQWHNTARITGAESDQESGTFSALVLEETPQFGVGIGTPVAKLLGYLVVVSNIIRLWHPNLASVTKLADEIVTKLGSAVTPPVHESGRANFSDITLEAMLFPTRSTRAEEVEGKMAEHAATWFEETWMQRPLKALSGVNPRDAAAHPTIRKRLPGVIRFMEECLVSTSPRVSDGKETHPLQLYDFDRLRRKLGLLDAETPSAESGSRKIDTLSIVELAALNATTLNDAELEVAFRTALKLDAREVAGKFARAMIDRPANAEHPDRYPYFHCLIQLAQAENDSTTALALLDRAEAADVETNQAQRQDDYCVRRAQILAKRGDIDLAYQAFQSLLARKPDELKHYGPAIETMLTLKKGDWALQFAEAGLAKARSQNNRDSEQYFMELAAAARKMG